MTTSELRPGTKVTYIGKICAEVLSVRSNGIKIGFWGRGLKEGQYVTRRVPRADIAACEAA